MNGISVLRKEATQSSLTPLPCGVMKRGPSPHSSGTLILDFQSPELRAISFFAYTPPSLWCFVITAQTNGDMVLLPREPRLTV